MLVLITEKRIVAERKERLDWVRVAGVHGSKQFTRIGHLAAHYEVCIAIAPDSLRGLFQDLGSSISQDGVTAQDERPANRDKVHEPSHLIPEAVTLNV